MLATAILSLAIVAQDHAPLRVAARDTAQQEALLLQGEVLEVRGQRDEYLQVYDHRLERGGYVRAWQLRSLDTSREAAPALLSVTRFLRDTPGSEALGIAYAAAYLKAAPSEAIDAESFDAIGTMAERLAARGGLRDARSGDASLAEHLLVVGELGVTMKTIERAGEVELCYDGDAFKRVLGVPATPLQRAHAALSLTRHDCVDPSLAPAERLAFDQWRAQVLDAVALTDLPDYVAARIHMRRAVLWAAIAFEQARRGVAAQAAGERAINELAVVARHALPDADASTYADAALRVGASRWAALAPPDTPNTATAANRAGLSISTEPGETGQTCVLLHDAHDPGHPTLLRRCTYGIVWSASASPALQSTGLALAVQMTDTWRELWLFHESAGGWIVDVVPPSASGPDLGYLEFAGWVPGGQEILLAREAVVGGRIRHSFEVMRVSSLEIEHQADNVALLSAFGRWQDRAWAHQTVSLR
jgi:hypothetical protein